MEREGRKEGEKGGGKMKGRRKGKRKERQRERISALHPILTHQTIFPSPQTPHPCLPIELQLANIKSEQQQKLINPDRHAHRCRNCDATIQSKGSSTVTTLKPTRIPGCEMQGIQTPFYLPKFSRVEPLFVRYLTKLFASQSVRYVMKGALTLKDFWKSYE